MCHLSFLCEIWQKKGSKYHRFKIEELLQLRGISYISTPRAGRKRGGGAAITANSELYHLTKLPIHIPNRLELVWGLLRPKNPTGKVKSIIVCCFYSPPKSKKKTALIDHMTLTIQELRLKYPNAGVILSGDRNDLPIARLLSVDTSLKQIVQKPTRGPNILTVVLTDLKKFYLEPEIIPPIEVDNPDAGGVPSDHDGVIVSPLSNVPEKMFK